MSTIRPSSHTGRGLSPREAIRLQSELSKRVVFHRHALNVRTVGGADVSYDPGTDRYRAAVVLLSWPRLETIGIGRASGRVTFPYIPGLLSFREIPPILKAIRRLPGLPDLLICDGQGLAHPRFFGLACHLGLLLGIPAIGCAKTLLVGEHPPVPEAYGSRVPLRYRGRRVGMVLRTRVGVRPVFVSPGHLISIGQAADWILRCARGRRIPEPTRIADREVSRLRRRPTSRGAGIPVLPVLQSARIGTVPAGGSPWRNHPTSRQGTRGSGRR